MAVWLILMISKALGSRHRAAIGMSEVSDAVIVVVSEETGTISIAENGSLTRFYNKDTLRKLLTAKLIPEKPEAKKMKGKALKKHKKNAPDAKKEIQKAMINIKNKYGKNAIIKGMNLQKEGTTIERNGQIGGHKE